MSKLILGLMGLALMGGNALLGQTPQVGPKAELILPPIVSIPQAGACSSGDCCSGGCCAKTRTVCVPEHYEKKREKVVYTFGCEKKCLPFCHGLLACFDCGDCDHGRCGHAIHVRYLVKKVRICEHDAVKCNPVEVPACRQDCRCADSNCDGNQGVILTQPLIQQPASAGVPSTSNKLIWFP